MATRWNPSTRQQAINRRKLGGANATPAPTRRGAHDRRPRPDTTDDRWTYCRRYLACKPHPKHIHRAGNQSVYCPGLA